MLDRDEEFIAGGRRSADLLEADVVEEPICVNPKAHHQSLIAAFEAEQTGYLTDRAVSALTSACTDVVVEVVPNFQRQPPMNFRSTILTRELGRGDEYM
ncbi:hypothetical protein HKX48_006824 [Thoreauomyces humboldtii]|nr:hypothetical protein HKX48_006824 [Thoreauomyces humboldtii]